RPLQQIAPGLQGVFTPFAGEPLPDLVPGPGRLDDPQPVAGRSRVRRLRGEDVDRVAGLQLVVEWYQPAADARTHATMPHLRVDGIGEVDGGRPSREV